MNKNLSFNLVFLAGSINREASIKAATDVLDKFIADHDSQNDTISAAVKTVFDAHRGENITMPTIEGMALRHLSAQPNNYKSLGKLVLDYVRANAGERSTGAIFGIHRGKNGGVCRWSDVPDKSDTQPASDENEGE